MRAEFPMEQKLLAAIHQLETAQVALNTARAIVDGDDFTAVAEELRQARDRIYSGKMRLKWRLG